MENREILFRGKRTDTGEWCWGNYVEVHGNVYIGEVGLQSYDHVKVRRETVGQFTGMVDRDGSKIFDGDLINASGYRTVMTHDYSDARKFVSGLIKDTYDHVTGRFTFKVLWQQSFAQWRISAVESGVHIETDVSKRDYRIIGNIHDNPELIKKE